MAIFGRLDIVKQQVDNIKFKKVFKYLEKCLLADTIENNRLLSLVPKLFKKIVLDKNNFALEQAYDSKKREECFFESHRKYIDVQLILESEEIIEATSINDLVVNYEYDKDTDLIQYKDTKQASAIKLKKGDIAIFYTQDAHMPCVKVKNCVKVDLQEEI